MDNRRQSIGSDASTTLSSFVRRRFNGEVPIFGGDVRTGVAEVTRAVSNTVQTNMATALLAMSQALVTMSNSTEDTGASISMQDNTRIDHVRYDQSDLLKCADLDDDQLRLLLDASVVSTQQAKAFQSLIYATRDAVRKKKTSLELEDMRKTALLAIDYSLRDDELENVLGSKTSMIREYAFRLGFVDDAYIKLVERAFIHDSATNGRITNRSLALVGDASLSLLLRKRGYACNLPVSRISQLSQRMLSNIALRDIGLKAALHHMIVVGANTDSSSRTIVATTVEALFGAAEIAGGEGFVRSLNDEHLTLSLIHI